MANVPFVVSVTRCKDNRNVVSTHSPDSDHWPSIWMNASDFSLREDQEHGYFICTAKGNQLRVHKEVFPEGTLLRKKSSAKPFLMRVYRMNHPYTRALNPQVVAQSKKSGVYPAFYADADQFPMKEGQREAYFICTQHNGKLRVHCEAVRKDAAHG